MGVLFARGYVLQMGDNIKRSKEQSARNGIWMGLAPTGTSSNRGLGKCMTINWMD